MSTSPDARQGKATTVFVEESGINQSLIEHGSCPCHFPSPLSLTFQRSHNEKEYLKEFK